MNIDSFKPFITLHKFTFDSLRVKEWHDYPNRIWQNSIFDDYQYLVYNLYKIQLGMIQQFRINAIVLYIHLMYHNNHINESRYFVYCVVHLKILVFESEKISTIKNRNVWHELSYYINIYSLKWNIFEFMWKFEWISKNLVFSSWILCKVF